MNASFAGERWRVYYGPIPEMPFGTKEEAEESARRLREELERRGSTLPVTVRREA